MSTNAQAITRLGSSHDCLYIPQPTPYSVSYMLSCTVFPIQGQREVHVWFPNCLQAYTSGTHSTFSLSSYIMSTYAVGVPDPSDPAVYSLAHTIRQKQLPRTTHSSRIGSATSDCGCRKDVSAVSRHIRSKAPDLRRCELRARKFCKQGRWAA